MAKKDYTNWDRNDLIKEIEQLRKRKKFGLIWEVKPENVVEQCKKELPVLEEVKNRKISTDIDKPVNLLIEGDNYHALSVLNYTHKGKIDVIYIDPPYNTGARDWKYNNDYVDAYDAYRHSKWLSMMNNRLKLAKGLLSTSGIICCTVDDYEAPRLTMLMDEIFGEANRLGTVVIKNNPSGRSTERGFSIAHEYALFYSRSAKPSIGRLSRTDIQISRYKEKDEVSAFEWVNFRKHGAVRSESPKMFYPIFIKGKQVRIPQLEWDANKQEYTLIDQPTTDEDVIYPIDENGFDRRWKWGIERARKEINEMKVRKDRFGKPAVYIKARMNDKGMLPLTWWDKTEYSATAYGTNLLKKIFGSLQVFSYPKSLYAVMDCLRVMSTKNDCLVLDFFAGSGTTGHAVFELNKEDNGNRKFILCTNNENGIAENVTLERLKKVINGYGDVAAYPSNLRYYKTAFVPADPTDKNKIELTQKATEMLCVKENTFEEVESKEKFKIFSNKKYYTGIIFDHRAIDDFKKAIKDIDGRFSVYVFSLGDDTFDEEFEDIKSKVKLSPIPEAILRVYRRIFK